MTLELVLARKAITAAVLAPGHWAWKLLLVRIGTMLGLAVASEIPKVLGDDLTVLLETCILSGLAVVTFLVSIESPDVIIISFGATIGETAIIFVAAFEKTEAVHASTTFLKAQIIHRIISGRRRWRFSWRDGTGISAVSDSVPVMPRYVRRSGII